MRLTTTHTNELEALLHQCKNGDERAQLSIYKRYNQAMYNTALRIVKDPAEAQDVMQESFLSAFTKLDSFKGDATFGAWLKRIVVNNSLTAYRKNTRHKTVDFNEVEERLDVPDDAEDSGLTDETKNSETVKLVLKTMQGLKRNYRLILTLNLIEGYDYDEICEIMDITNSHCRTMVHRAKESLKKKLPEL